MEEGGGMSDMFNKGTIGTLPLTGFKELMFMAIKT